ncbi:hypothetical protein [Stenotrophomonas indicatrix]|uniref:hypothetical protein n=1 Tax=Stenotrophomonas indicatrix TaxID=2045451 RepID=UPI0008C56E74|nr:hypothetical protein [Stenotrophomonas indicatrix]SET72922.1 hypothetical protein SAMN05720615_10728 [Stenotrophomonas indicatrix]
MKVSAVYIDLECYSYPLPLRVRYQLASNYLSLFISDWIKERRLDLGPFIRLVFVEGSKVDMQVMGDRALAVRISETACASGAPFAHEREATSSVDTHNYFVGKYLEGFNHVDGYFGVSLYEPLAEAITVNFSSRYAYEKPAVDRDGKNEKLQLLHRYTTDRYQLIAVEGGGGADSLAPEYALVELIPDPFKVSYHVSSIVVDGRRISIANKTGSEVLVREI